MLQKLVGALLKYLSKDVYNQIHIVGYIIPKNINEKAAFVDTKFITFIIHSKWHWGAPKRSPPLPVCPPAPV